jgi:hypothetical protein
MRKTVIGNILMLVLGVLTAQMSAAQGTTTFLSNVGQTPDGSNPVASDSWLAEGFITGGNSGGYVLSSVQLGLAGASGNPSSFTVMIYSEGNSLGSIIPGGSIGTLTGSANPASAGIYTYAAPQDITLSPGTEYYIVITSGTMVANGAYSWNFLNTSAFQPQDGWGASVTLSSGNGSSWTRLGSSPNYDYSEFAINATPAPEPGVLGLFALGGLLVALQRRKTRSVQ